MIFTEVEFVSLHTPLFTNARNHVSTVTEPMAAAVKVVVVFGISVVVPTLKLDVVDLCHLTTVPV